MRHGLLVCGLTGALLAATTPAVAQQVLPPPPQFTKAERAGWQAMMGPTPLAWSPTGTMVADTGFRPAVNGFRFFNYATADSVPNIANAYAFHEPAKVTNLAAPQLRTLFGDVVCRSAQGSCELTYAARRWRDATNAVISSGHCWGLAVGAAVRYSRGSPPARDAHLSVPLQRRIARWQATQFEVDIDQYLTDPRSVVAALRRDLVAGRAPYVILVESAQGLQHTLTPYALLDRGGDRYDIAVYDSNYPGRERAIHVDAAANTFAYEAFSQPQVEIATAHLGLVPVAALTGEFACPFCPGASQVRVHLWSPHGRSSPVSAALTVHGSRVARSTPGATWDGTERLRSSTWRVQPGEPFVLSLRTDSARAVKLSTLVTTGDLTWRMSGVRVRRGPGTLIRFHPQRQTLVSSAAVGAVTVVDAQPGAEVHVRVASAPARPVAVGVGQERIIIGARSKGTSRVRVVAKTVQVDRRGVFRHATRRSLDVTANGRLSIDYADWSRRHPHGVRISTPAGPTGH